MLVALVFPRTIPPSFASFEFLTIARPAVIPVVPSIWNPYSTPLVLLPKFALAVVRPFSTVPVDVMRSLSPVSYTQETLPTTP